MIAHDHALGIEAGWRRRCCGCVHESPAPKADAILIFVQRTKVHEPHQLISDGVLYVVWQLSDCREYLLQCFSHAKDYTTMA